MQIAFAKGHGTGNDFVLVADPDGTLEIDASLAQALCDRRFGIGADGLIRAVRSERLGDAVGADAAAEGAEWFMDYRNADGSLSEMCGNGARVFGRFLEDEGLTVIGDGVRIGTRAGVKSIARARDDLTVGIGAWSLTGEEPLVHAHGLHVARPGLGISVGNPHIVVALADDAELDAIDLGRPPALDPPLPDGANVEFVVPGAISREHGSLRMRVHERGSGETLSCGTGAVAAAMAVRHWAGAGAPDRWLVDVPGGLVAVEVTGTETTLTGPAEIVYRGVIEA